PEAGIAKPAERFQRAGKKLRLARQGGFILLQEGSEQAVEFGLVQHASLVRAGAGQHDPAAMPDEAAQRWRVGRLQSDLGETEIEAIEQVGSRVHERSVEVENDDGGG